MLDFPLIPVILLFLGISSSLGEGLELVLLREKDWN
jgi:formate-dependent nitrite reductase membrane component NrfD